jgi:hypothetical protein
VSELPARHIFRGTHMHAQKAFNTKNLTESHIQRLTKALLIHIYVPLLMSVCRVHAQTMNHQRDSGDQARVRRKKTGKLRQHAATICLTSIIKARSHSLTVSLHKNVASVGAGPLRRPAPFARRESSMKRAKYQAVRLALLS